jgi:DNA-binding NarL/FixJ family response regulator
MKNKNSIRVILADDHAIIRRGVRRILEKASSICVIGEATTGMDALRLVQELKPDVLVLDIEMPDMKGISVARELRAKQVPVSIVILSACDDDYFIKESLRVGVDAYLNKSESPARIREAIVHAFKKRSTFAVVPLVTVLLPKIGWALYQTLHSVSSFPLDNLL